MRKLAIISHVIHFQHEGRLSAYGPYAREVERWARLFPEVVISAPLGRGVPPEDNASMPENVTLDPQWTTGGNHWWEKLFQLLVLPILGLRLALAMRRADAIQVRCPGNLGFLAAALAPLIRKPRVAKYAGQWPDWPREPFSWRLGKCLLRSRWWNAPVLVYGTWPDQPSHIVPFFTSVMDDAQMARAAQSKPRLRTSTLHVLFVGRLSAAKNVHVLLRAVAACCRDGKDVNIVIVGDGPERCSLEALAKEEDIDERVTFTGALPQEQVFSHYEKAHVLVLASNTEGWPKALTEGMAFANVCIASNRGLVPQMLAEGRGLLIEPGSVAALSKALNKVYDDSTGAARMAETAAAWSRRFTLDGFERELRNVLGKQWGRSFNVPSAMPQIATSQGA